VSCFTPDLAIGNVADVTKGLMSIVPDNHGIMPFPFTCPQDAPPEIPRVVLLNSAQSFQVHVSLIRTDLRYHPLLARKAGDVEVSRSGFWKLGTAFCRGIVRELGWSCNRLAAILELRGTMLESEPSPSDFIRRSLIRKKLDTQLLNSLEGSEVHLHRSQKLRVGRRKIQMNTILRLKSVPALGADVDPNGELYLECDYNTTHLTTDLRFNPNEISTFMGHAAKHITSQIHLVEKLNYGD
jgi:hypothetical protein